MNPSINKRGIIILIGLALIALLMPPYSQWGVQEMPLDVLKAKYATLPSHFMNINGTLIHYRDQGQGPVIVALHGIVDSLYTWDRWAKALSTQYRFVRLDLPGFGLTGPLHSNEKYSPATYIKYLDAFLTRLGIDQCYLVGNSLGGAIAWNYALAFPYKVKKLVLLDPAGYHMDVPWPIDLAGIPIMGWLSTKVTPRFVYGLSLREVFWDPAKVTESDIDRFYEMSLRPGNREAYRTIFNVLSKINDDPAFASRIKNMKVPTLLIWGKEDPWIPVAQVAQWKKDVPGIQTLIYPHVGHVPQMEIPAISAQAADNFISTPSPDHSRQASPPWPIVVIGALFLLGIFIYQVLFRKNR